MAGWTTKKWIVGWKYSGLLDGWITGWMRKTLFTDFGSRLFSVKNLQYFLHYFIPKPGFTIGEVATPVKSAPLGTAVPQINKCQ